MQRKIFRVQNDELFVNVFDAKSAYLNRGKGLVTMYWNRQDAFLPVIFMKGDYYEMLKEIQVD